MRHELSPEQIALGKLAKSAWGYRYHGNLVGERDALKKFIPALEARLAEVRKLISEHGTKVTP